MIWMDGQRHEVCSVPYCSRLTRVELGQLYVMPGQPERWCCMHCIEEQERIEESEAREQGGVLSFVEGWR